MSQTLNLIVTVVMVNFKKLYTQTWEPEKQNPEYK